METRIHQSRLNARFAALTGLLWSYLLADHGHFIPSTFGHYYLAKTLNLKTEEEIGEILYEVRSCFLRIASVEKQFDNYTKTDDLSDSFQEMIWNVLENGFMILAKLNAYFRRREMVLVPYTEEIRLIIKYGHSIDDQLWDFKNKTLSGYTDQQLKAILKGVENEVVLLLEKVEVLQRKLQDDFLGHIYGRKISNTEGK